MLHVPSRPAAAKPVLPTLGLAGLPDDVPLDPVGAAELSESRRSFMVPVLLSPEKLRYKSNVPANGCIGGAFGAVLFSVAPVRAITTSILVAATTVEAPSV